MKKIDSLVSNIVNKVLDEVYPKNFSCYNCSKEIEHENSYHLCKSCFESLKPLKNTCKICGDELNGYTNYCYYCKNFKRYFDRVESVTDYENVGKELVHKLKYNGQVYIADTIGLLLANKFESCKFDNINLVVCVPLGKERLKQRGFNQAAEILKAFVKVTKLNYDLNLINKLKDTISQTNFTKEERLVNLKDSFLIDKNIDIKNKNILVIDDVITTGSTIDEIAKVLKANGAKKVYGLTLCHTKFHKKDDEPR